METSFYKIQNFFLIFLFLISSFMFTTVELVNLSSDYGVYYGHAMFFNDKYSLYYEAFDHKGPIYYLFIKLIGSIFGWGGYLTFLPLFFSSLIFLLSFFFFLESLNLKKDKIFLLVLASISCFFNQGGNSSIIFFALSLILFQISFLIKFIEKNNFFYYVLSIFFLSLAILTRIDLLLFFTIPIFHLVFLCKNLKVKFLCCLIIFLVFLLVYSFTALYFKFTFEVFYLSNIEFNSINALNYKKNFLSHFRKMESQKIFFGSGIGVLLFIILNQFLPKLTRIKEKIYQNKIKQKYLISFFVSCIFFILFLVHYADKPHNTLNLSIGSLVLCSILVNFIEFKKVILFPILIIFLLSFFYTTLIPTFKFLKSYGCIERLECSAFNDIKDTIKDVSNYKEAAVIGDASWIHIFSKTRPSLSLVTWPLIEENKMGSFFRMTNTTTKLLYNNKQIVWVSKNNYEKFKNIFKKQKILESQKSYLKIQLN